MPFKPGREPVAPDFKRLLGTLNHSEVRNKDYALYQVVKSLVDWSNQQVQVTNSQIAEVSETISQIPSPGGGDNGNGGTTPPPVTPTVDNDHVPMTTGAEPIELMSNGEGELLVVGYSE